MIAATPDTMTWAREHIPDGILQGMIEDGFLKEVKTEEMSKNGK